MGFEGQTFNPGHDDTRLGTQLERVKGLMSDTSWRTLSEIRSQTGGSEAGISARLRDLRKTKFGGHTVLRRRRGVPSRGLWEYRLLVNLVDQLLWDDKGK